jgi:outer membrane murein-binding lipoprotein Lpp
MDPLTILAGLKTGLAAGKTVASLSKEISNFFDATDAAKKKLQKKGISSSDVNSIAMDRWAKEQEAAQAEQELREWVCNNLGKSKWDQLLRIRKEVLQEKREMEARLRREAIERQELMITIAGIVVLLTFAFVGSAGYLHYMGWIDVRDWMP